MAQEINHYCIICGKGYHACDSCYEVKTFKPWRILTDTIEHWKIYMTINDFKDGIISKDEAARQLQNCDLTGKESFKPSAKKSIEKILSESTKVTKKSKGKGNTFNPIVTYESLPTDETGTDNTDTE